MNGAQRGNRSGIWYEFAMHFKQFIEEIKGKKNDCITIAYMIPGDDFIEITLQRKPKPTLMPKPQPKMRWVDESFE